MFADSWNDLDFPECRMMQAMLGVFIAGFGAFHRGAMRDGLGFKGRERVDSQAV